MLVAGLMSGTSADAIDVAIVEIHGHRRSTRIRLVGFHSEPYQRAVRERILRVAGGAAVSAQEISQLNFLLGELFGRACLTACRRHRVARHALKLIGSHGQTIHHQPIARRECGLSIRSTLQIGEPAVISAMSGTTVIADFRTADIALGGQGAPLVPYFDYLLYRHPKRGRVLVNIGGIANLTAIPAGAGPEKIMAFDTGPGNMLIDQLAALITKGRQRFDRNGRLARNGVIDERQITRMLRQPYFLQLPPKSTGRERFGQDYLKRWFRVSPESDRQSQLNAIATATAFTAESIAQAIGRFVLPAANLEECYVSGGGVMNSFLMTQLLQRLSRITSPTCELRLMTTEALAIPSCAKEAAAFALLAYQTYHRQPSNMPAATGASSPAILGKTVSVFK